MKDSMGMASPTLRQAYTDFQARFSKQSKFELINAFNRETSHQGWVASRGAYLKALCSELEKKGVDTSALVTDKGGFSMAHPVYMDKRNKLVPIGKK